MRSTRVLLAARDAGGAGHIAEIARALQAQKVAIQIVAEGPALALLANERLSVLSVLDWLGCELPKGPVDPCFVPILSGVLARVGADAVVVGQSARTETSIDDWMLAASGNIPAAVMQDFWGEVQAGQQQNADLFLVLDSEAERLTRAKVSAQVVVVGSPKHARYGRLDWQELRVASRAAMGIIGEKFVIGHFGQDLQRLAGYRTLVSDIASAVAMQNDVKLVYRPHPRESPASVISTLAILRKKAKNTTLLKGMDIEGALAGVDAVVSCFSSCGYDGLYLTRHLNGLGPSVVYVDYDPEIKSYWTQHAGVDALPAVEAGIAFEARDFHDLVGILKSIRRPETRSALGERICRLVPDPIQAPELAARAVLSIIERMRQGPARSGSRA
jgi:hypothetical protein